MAFDEESIVQAWLNSLQNLNVKKRCLAVTASIVTSGQLAGYTTVYYACKKQDQIIYKKTAHKNWSFLSTM